MVMSGNDSSHITEDLLSLEDIGIRDSDWTYKSKEPAKYAKLWKEKSELDTISSEFTKNRQKLFKSLENYDEIQDNLYQYFTELDEFFKNPKCVASDKLILYVEKGNAIMGIKAISPYWTDNWVYGYYEDSITATELAKLSQGFAWLSTLPFYRFWSQIIYVKNTLKALKSFIYQKNLYFYSRDDDSNSYNKRYREIYHNIYQVLLRLVQTEVSKFEKLTLKTHKQILKQKNIFTHDMILPICRLYGNIIHTKVLFHQLFALQHELSTIGLAAVAIECQNVLPLLTNHLRTLPDIINTNAENVYIAYLIVLNFTEDICALRILLENYPPFEFIMESLQIEKQLLSYVGYQLFEVGKILCKVSSNFKQMVNHNYLWEKFCKIAKDVVDIYRVFINKAINDLLDKNEQRDEYSEEQIKELMKRYVDLLEQIFLCNFYGFQYVKYYNVAEDNSKILKAFPTLSSSQRSVLMTFEKIAEEFKKEYFLHEVNDISDEAPIESKQIYQSLSNISDISHLYAEGYDNNWKLQVSKAIHEQRKVFNRHCENFKGDDPTKLIEKFMNKGFVNSPEIFSAKSSFANLQHRSTSQLMTHPFESPSNISQSILRRLKKIRKEFSEDNSKHGQTGGSVKISPNKSDGGSRKLLETKFDFVCQQFKVYRHNLQNRPLKHNGDGESKTTHDQFLELSSAATGKVPSNSSSANLQEAYVDDAGAIQRAISESLKGAEISSSTPDDVVFQSLISEVKDILPHLGEGFIKQCLEVYNCKTDVIISAILEDRLHPSLQKLDQSLPIIPPEKPEVYKRTVFEGDEIDKMVKTKFDSSRIFRKKNKLGFNTASSFLDDKSHIKTDAERYQKLGMDYYNDDYDDEYDVEPDLNGDDPHSDDEDGAFNRPLNKRLNRKTYNQTVSTDDSDEESENKPVRNNLDFCEDPAVVRARAEARRNSKMAQKPSGKPSGQRDVVGNPKGQGQDKSVLINRAKKNENKSQKANHNRRSGAQYKRNRGMIPS